MAYYDDPMHKGSKIGEKGRLIILKWKELVARTSGMSSTELWILNFLSSINTLCIVYISIWIVCHL